MRRAGLGALALACVAVLACNAASAARAAVPILATAYVGQVYNETVAQGATGELRDVTETAQGAISGWADWGSPLVGDGRFEGQVSSDGSITFTISEPGYGFEFITLTGEVSATGSMHGHYEVGGIHPQVGRWEFTPNGPPALSPPAVEITSHPPGESSRQAASFGFSGASGGTYECSLDAGSWVPCTSGQTYDSLLPGDHRFRVRESLNGLTGPEASYSWTVDLPRACILKVARARVFAFVHQKKARLVIRYKAYKPADVTVFYRLEGKRGSLLLGAATSQFQTAGVFRLPESLTGQETQKMRATKSIVVHFSIPDAPDSCNRYYTKRLTIPKQVFGQTVWFQSDSIFAAGGG